MLLALTVALLLGQNTATLSGLPPRTLAPSLDYSGSVLSTIPVECACADLTFSDGAAITTTRNSSAYCTASTGVMTSCGNGKPRVSAAGLLSEPAGNNFTLKSQALDTWTCTNVTTPTADTEVSPTGATDAELLVGTGAGGFCESDILDIGNVGTISAYVQTTSGTQSMALVLWDVVAGAADCTGTVTATTAWSKKEGTTDNRVKCTAPVITGANEHRVRIYPGGVAGTGTVRAWGVNTMEIDPPYHSYIPADTTYEIRQADVLSFTPAVSINTAGCMTMAVIAPAPAFPQHIWSCSSQVAFNNTVSVFFNDGTTSTSSPNVSNMTLRSAVVRALWAGSAKQVNLDGNAGTPGSFDGTQQSGLCYLGSNQSNQNMHGWMKDIRYGPSGTGCAP